MEKNKKHNILPTSFRLMLFTAFLGGALAACSDDHYDAETNPDTRADKTLWENICSNSQLTQFAQLAKQGGYDVLLDGENTYTVWAPQDGTFNYEHYVALSNDDLTKQFLGNQLAPGLYGASGNVNENITMANTKTHQLAGSAGSYTIDSLTVVTPNVPSSNGVMHITDSALPFRSNLYEYLSSTAGLDSLSAFFRRYETRVLDVDNSVIGPVVNGEITYLDSVVVESNSLFTSLGRAYLNCEDSTYTMIMPTNEAWNKGLVKLRSYYNYAPVIWYGSIDTDGRVTSLTMNVDASTLGDSLAHRNLVSDLVFNNRYLANGVLSSAVTGIDSIVSTTGDVFRRKDGEDLFVDGHRETMSNGFAVVTDSLRMQPVNSWCKPIVVEAEREATRPALRYVGDSKTVTVTASNRSADAVGSVSGSYIDLLPQSDYANPEAFFYLPDVLSTTYNIYAVIVPSNFVGGGSETALPNSLRAELGYSDESGHVTSIRLSNLISNPAKVDTMFVGSVSFPVSYAGLDNVYPYLRLYSFATRSELRSGKYSNELCIDRIILVPKEVDDYQENETH
jgi:uncharacterized surface protein with fasciclin (FAS1) repeats